MTFVLRGPFTDVHSEVSPLIATEWGLEISRAVDGTAGGTWIGVNTWQGAQTFSGTATFDGLAQFNNADSHYNMIRLIGTDAGICYRAPSDTLGNANADVTIDYDVWRMTTAPNTAAKVYTLRHTLAGSIPSAGQHVLIVFADTDVIAPANAEVRREGAPGTLLATFVGATGTYGWAEFQYTAGGWILIRWGGAVNAEPGGGAPMP